MFWDFDVYIYVLDLYANSNYHRSNLNEIDKYFFHKYIFMYGIPV